MKDKVAAAIDKTVFPGIQGGPLMHVIAGKAVCFREALQPEFKEYQKKILENAQYMANAFQSRGYRLVSGGTDTHLMLVDLREKGVTGKAAENGLEKAGITVNKNTIPFDPEKPFIASGIRVGTPALTTRGMGKDEIEKVVALIDRALSDIENEQVLEACEDRRRASSARPSRSCVGEERPAARAPADGAAAASRPAFCTGLQRNGQETIVGRVLHEHRAPRGGTLDVPETARRGHSRA